MFSHFSRIPTCDGHTDRQTHDHGIYRESIARTVKTLHNLVIFKASKLLKHLVTWQLLDYLTAANLLPDLQSAYRAHHSMETAVLKVLSDILRALDSGDLALLTLVNLSAAFDAVHHTTLLRRLKMSYGLDGCVLSW